MKALQVVYTQEDNSCRGGFLLHAISQCHFHVSVTPGELPWPSEVTLPPFLPHFAGRRKILMQVVD